MIRSHQVVEVSCTPQAAFTHIAVGFFENHSRWDPAVTGMTKISEDPVGVGTVGQERRKMIQRFPDMETVSAMLEALATTPEPIGDDLRALDLPLLLAKHDGCLGSTDEGFEHIVGAFPEAQTVICPEACTSSPAFADANRAFCGEVVVVTGQ